MPIIRKSVLEARRAAAAAAKAAAGQAAVSDAALSQPLVSLDEGNNSSARAESAAFNGTELPPDPKPARRRGHAVKDARGKWQPAGDYPEGFARTSEKNRFKDGCKPGPGRPKGSVSHDTLIANHLRQKREVSLNGKRQLLSSRELLVISTVKSALEGKDKQARAYLLTQDQRLHPSKESEGGAQDATTFSASDLLSLQEYEEEMRKRLRAEIRAELESGEGEDR